jgi:hypothetical protein
VPDQSPTRLEFVPLAPRKALVVFIHLRHVRVGLATRHTFRRVCESLQVAYEPDSRCGGKMSIFPANYDQERKKRNQICALVKVPCVHLDEDRSSTGLRNLGYLAPLQTALVTALLRTDPDERNGLALRTTVSLHGFPTVRL